MAAKRTGNASPLIGQCSARRGEMRWRGSCKGFKNGGGGRGVGVYRAHFLHKNPTVKSSLPFTRRPPRPCPRLSRLFYSWFLSCCRTRAVMDVQDWRGEHGVGVYRAHFPPKNPTVMSS